MSVLENLQPSRVFFYFEELCKIPHGSYNTREISDYLVSFAEAHKLKYMQDEYNNVVIFKPASCGYEAAPVTILQGHCDMVCEKKPGSGHDFMKDPLDLAVDGDLIYAKDTTLGGDDGIAIAFALAILEDDAILHPALEVVITTDEEVGLLGASALDTSVLKGEYMLNLDSEEEGHILTGCAGGMTAKSRIPLQYRKVDGTAVSIAISGLEGGHSGIEITKKRGNANILMGRFLYELGKTTEFSLMDIGGGLKDNAIPRMCTAQILTSGKAVSQIAAYAAVFQENLRTEYSGSDEQVEVTAEIKEEGSYEVLNAASQARVIFYLMNIPNGILKMSAQIEGLVESSTNLGILKLEDGMLLGSSSSRSSVSSAKDAIGDKICFLTEFLGGEYTEQGAYPAWEYNPDSKLRELMIRVYEVQYGSKPVVEVIHAGLECGIFYERLNNLDCVSFGPDIMNIHTTEEKLSISSVQRTWEYVLAVLKEIK